jgi:muramoyltetrapeptide carboxypeptidase
MILKPNDKVAIVAPASQLRHNDQPMLAEAMEILEAWGLAVDLKIETDHQFYLAGSDQARASHLIGALEDEETRAIFCTRGGYGSPRLLRHLNGSVNPTSKFLIGYSDISALHLGIGNRWPGVVRIHGPNVATKQFTGKDAISELNRKTLYDVLFDSEAKLEEKVEFLCPGVARGPLEGGCLSLISAVVGTKYMPNVKGSILFIEDVGEPPYKIDRMLTQLKNADLFNEVKGVVFGAMHNCSDPYNDLKAVLYDLFCEMQIPVAFGLPSGHGERNMALRLGALAELDNKRGTFRTVEE